MDITLGLKAIPKLIRKVFAGQAVRNDIIANANQLATSILTASAFTANRLNSALLASGKARIKIISQLTKDEIESFSRMNGHCALIYGASNALSRWTTNEAMNINVTGRSDAVQVLKILEGAENGMQVLFNELLTLPPKLQKASNMEVEKWIRDAIVRTSKLTQAANECVVALAQII